jgi:alcohol dehydrogenase
MIPFDFQPRTRIIYGPGKIYSLGDLAGELGARRVLLVSDHGIVAAGHAQRAMDALAKANIEAHVFSEFHENPNSDDVDAGVKIAKRYDPELLIGLGGGSSMDCAKGINFVYTNGGRIHDYWGIGKALKPMLPMIAVPTTAGTGSEAQSFALISDAKTHVKMACGDKKAACRIALLDPTLTVTQPRKVTALTGIDAIAHALETYVTKPRNPISLAFSREAWRLLAENFGHVLEHPADLDARGAMQLGACFAGMAIETSMLGATHALANPLTAEYDIVHGQAIGLMLPHVIRFNGETVPHWYRELSDSLTGINGFPSFDRGPDGLASFVSRLVNQAGLPQKLSECSVDRASLPKLAEAAAKQWTGTFNPRQVGVAELLRLYEDAF